MRGDFDGIKVVKIVMSGLKVVKFRDQVVGRGV